MNKDRERLLYKIQAYDFALVDVGEFLNTHPNCKGALNYYKKYQRLYKQALADYTARYGALCSKDVTSCDSWTWAEEAWPWQKGV